MVQRYAANTNNVLVVQFKSVGEVAGHCKRLLQRMTEAPKFTSSPLQQSGPHQPSTSTTTQGIKETIQALSSLPKIETKGPRRRRVESAVVLTSSPYKAALVEKNKSPKTNRLRTKHLAQYICQNCDDYMDLFALCELYCVVCKLISI